MFTKKLFSALLLPESLSRNANPGGSRPAPGSGLRLRSALSAGCTCRNDGSGLCCYRSWPYKEHCYTDSACT